MSTGAFPPEDMDELSLHLKQVNAIEAGSARRRRRFQVLEVVCTGCGNPVARVYRTSPYLSLRYRHPHGIAQAGTLGVTMTTLGGGIRRPEGQDLYVLSPDFEQWVECQPPPGGGFTSVCRCSRHGIGFGNLLDCLRRGDSTAKVRPAMLS